MQILCAKCNDKVGCFILLYFIKCKSIVCYIKQICMLGCSTSDDASLNSLCEKHLRRYDEKEEIYSAYLRHLELLSEISNDTEVVFPTASTTVYSEENLIPIAEIFEMSEELKTILLASGIEEGYYEPFTGKFVVRAKDKRGTYILHGISPILKKWEKIEFEIKNSN